MTRLFISPREIDFFADVTREISKDIVGQCIHYYPVSLTKTNVHSVYEEAVQKVFDTPVKIECRVKWQPSDISTGRFGHDATANITVEIQARDMVDREIDLLEGNFFTFGPQAYEITKVRTIRNIYGHVEFEDGIELTGKQARKDVFGVLPEGPTKEHYSDDDAVKETFVQQRGFERNKEGVTGDKRDLVDKEVLEAPDVSEPAEVSPRGSSGRVGSGFYGEGD